MNCENAKQLRHAWLDRELGATESRDFDAHIAVCPSCAMELKELAALQQAIRKEATYHALPPGLAEKIAARTGARVVNSPSGKFLPLKWGASGAGIAIAACLAFLFAVQPGEEYLIEQQLIASHVRSMQEEHLTDVVSTDQHTVKPWFNGRIDISPPVVDLKDSGFPLVGGRLDYIDHHTAAVIVYKYNSHVINLFIWPEAQMKIDFGGAVTQRGYNIRHWQDKDLQFWAVTDVNAGKLVEFEAVYRTRTAAK